MSRSQSKSGIIVNDSASLEEENHDDLQQTLPGVELPPLNSIELPPVPALDSSATLAVSKKSIPKKKSAEKISEGDGEVDKTLQNNDDDSDLNDNSDGDDGKQDSPRKRSLGEVMVMEKLTLPNPVSPSEKIEVYRLIPESINNGQSPADVEKWLVKEMEADDGVVDNGEFIVIRRVKTLRVEAEVIRRVTLEEVMD